MTEKRVTRKQLLEITNLQNNLLDHLIRTGFVPEPRYILWLNPPPDDKEYFPTYVIADIFRIKYLHTLKVSALWELRRFVLGNGGFIKYEADIKKLCGDIFYQKVDSNEGEVSESLCRLVEDRLQPYKIGAATFRSEEVAYPGSCLSLKPVFFR